MYAGRRGAVTETNRYTKGNTQVAAYLLGHTPEVEAKNYWRELPDETRKAALALDTALGDLVTTERQNAVNAGRYMVVCSTAAVFSRQALPPFPWPQPSSHSIPT